MKVSSHNSSYAGDKCNYMIASYSLFKNDDLLRILLNPVTFLFLRLQFQYILPGLHAKILRNILHEEIMTSSLYSRPFRVVFIYENQFTL